MKVALASRPVVSLTLIIALFAAAFFAGYHARLAYGPWKLMQQTYASWAPANRWFHDAGEPDAENWVKIANPDALVSRATYDLSAGPLLFEGALPEDEYWSLSFYDGRSVNAGTVSDESIDGGRYRVILAAPSAGEALRRRYPGVPVVTSDTRRGYAVVRLIIDRSRPLAATAATQADATIIVLTSGN